MILLINIIIIKHSKQPDMAISLSEFGAGLPFVHPMMVKSATHLVKLVMQQLNTSPKLQQLK